MFEFLLCKLNHYASLNGEMLGALECSEYLGLHVVED